MALATIRDARHREARAEWKQLAATAAPGAVSEAPWKPDWPSRDEIAEHCRAWMADGDGAAGERGLSGARLVDITAAEVIEGILVSSAARGALAIVPQLPEIDRPGPRASTTTAVGGVVIARTSPLRERFRELGDVAPAGEPARLLKAARRWLRPRERRTPPTASRIPFTLPETPSAAEMTIFETPFRIPRYMDHPEWRPC